MTNTINKIMHNGTEFNFESVNGGVTSFNGDTGAVTYTAPVTSVNGNTGAVTVNDVKQSASAPSSPTEGTVWYDTTNDVLKVYDGTSWNEVGGGNVIAMTQAEYDALPTATQNDGKLRIITDAPSIEMASKEYVDDLVGDIETLLAAL